MLLNDTLEIDCDLKTVKILTSTTEKNENKIGALTCSTVRPQWLDLLPSANELQIDDVDTTGTMTLTVTVNWYDRNN